MELWIRSQDKENLVKSINQIGLHYLNKNMIIANYQPDFIGTQGEYYEKLGTYKTKERALEVLDEINEILQIKLCTTLGTFEEVFNGYTEEQLKLILKQMAVYEMPKE